MILYIRLVLFMSWTKGINMNIRHLEILDAVEQTGTFTGAAKKLHLTQSAVSHAIAELEQQAGTVLFNRFSKGVSLTNCGLSLLGEARSVLAAYRNLDNKIEHLEECTPINIVSSITIASFLLPKILSQLKSMHPEIQVNVRVASANTAMDILQRGEADMALWEGVEPQGSYQTYLMGSYKLCAACAPNFILPNREISLYQLCGFPLLLREQGSAIRDTLDSVFSLANLKAYPVWESVNSFTLIKAAEAGLGITVLPESLLSDSLTLKKLRLIKLTGVKMENKMLAVLHKDKYITQPLQILLDTINFSYKAGWQI